MAIEILLPITSAFFGAIGTVISKKIVGEIGATRLTCLTFLTMSIIMIPLIPFFYSMSNYMLALPLIFVIVLLDAFANLLFFKGLNEGEVSKAAALDSLAPLFTAFLTPFLIPSQFGKGVFLAVFGITLSVYFIQTGHGIKQFINHIGYKKNYYVLLGAMIFGFTAILVRMALNELAITNPVTLYWVRAIGIFLVLYIIFNPDIKGFKSRIYSIILLKSVFVVVSWILLFYSISRFDLVFSYALANIAPLFVLILAWEEFGEEITLRKVAAIIILLTTIFVTQAL